MTNTKLTKQERLLLMAALNNEQERYERKASCGFFSRIAGYYDDIYSPKIKLLESIKQKLIPLDTEEDEHYHPEED